MKSLLASIFAAAGVWVSGGAGMSLLANTLDRPVSVSDRATAFAALSLLPEGEADRLAIVAGREGNPVPERWHLIVHAPGTENGLREYVVEDGRIVARREFSQFASKLTEADVIGRKLRVDSHQVAYVANEYARANHVVVASLGYDLRKDGPTSAPVWRVDCTGVEGEILGSISVAATTNPVLAHNGFAVAPKINRGTAQQPQASQPRDLAESDDEARAVRRRADRDRSEQGGFRGTARMDRRGSGEIDASEDDDPRGGERDRDESRVVIRRAEPVNPEDIVRRERDGVRRLLRSINPFDD